MTDTDGNPSDAAAGVDLRAMLGRLKRGRTEREDRLASIAERAESTGDYRRDEEIAAKLRDGAAEDLDASIDSVDRYINAPSAAAGSGDPDFTVWERAGYGADAARRWQAAGIDSPELAAEWREQGFTPENAAAWVSREGMTPSKAMTAVNAGKAPVDVERVLRADPSWTRPPDPEVAAPDMGPWL